MSPWLRVLEAWAVQQLLRTPGFHRGVEKVVRQVHRFQHGTPPDEEGGTKIDGPGQPGFIKHFAEEIKVQLGRAETKETGGVNIDSRAMSGKEVPHQTPTNSQAKTTVEDDSADSVWQTASKNAAEPPKQGFMGEYMSALRDQVRNNKPK